MPKIEEWFNNYKTYLDKVEQSFFFFLMYIVFKEYIYWNALLDNIKLLSYHSILLNVTSTYSFLILEADENATVKSIIYF